MQNKSILIITRYSINEFVLENLRLHQQEYIMKNNQEILEAQFHNP